MSGLHGVFALQYIQQVEHILGQRAFETAAVHRFRMNQPQRLGVQRLPRKAAQSVDQFTGGTLGDTRAAAVYGSPTSG